MPASNPVYTMSSADQPAFDWAQAASLLGDDPNSVEPDMAGIARELVETSLAQFQQLKAKKAETERKAISSQAHQLRGCLLNFGFSEVGSILQQIEKGDYSTSEYPNLLAKAEVAFDASRKMLAERYPSLDLP
jgi:HPt (histidine-containing phosphotransfer) domain-containing protein